MTPIMGDSPRGYQIATPDGRWLALATPSGRTAPATDEERAQAFRTMIGYSGRYRVEGSTITTKVDVAWNEIVGRRRAGPAHPIRRRQAVHREPADAASQHVRQDRAGDRGLAARRLVSRLNPIPAETGWLARVPSGTPGARLRCIPDEPSNLGREHNEGGRICLRRTDLRCCATPCGTIRWSCLERGQRRRFAGRVCRLPAVGADASPRRQRSGAPCSHRPPKRRRSRRRKPPVPLRPATAPLRLDCENETWPHLSPRCAEEMRNKNRTRVISTDKLDKPTVTAIEATPPAAPESKPAAPAVASTAPVSPPSSSPPVDLAAAPSAVFAAPETSPAAVTSRCAAAAQPAAEAEPKTEKRVATKSKRKPKGEPKTIAKQESDDDDDTPSRRHPRPTAIPTIAVPTGVSIAAELSSAGPSAITTCRLPVATANAASP